VKGSLQSWHSFTALSALQLSLFAREGACGVCEARAFSEGAVLSPPDPLARRANLYPANALGVNPPVMVSELVGVGLFTSPSETELRREIGPLTVRIGGGISVGMGLAGRIGLVWS